MNPDLETAVHVLKQNQYTCVLRKGDKQYTSTLRGVAPLLQLLDRQTDVRGFCAADRVVGRATAFLYALLGVRQVHALVMSEPALQVLHQQGIPASCDTLVDGIINRQKDGPCPMEAATMDLEDPHAALAAVRQTLKSLRK